MELLQNIVSLYAQRGDWFAELLLGHISLALTAIAMSGSLGLLLGVIEIFAGGYISTQLQNAIVFAVLIVVLLVKPSGLLGKQIREKV